ncbi:YeeE/YedE [Rugosibacter aromaticivorans]|uniref:YeeE/YedE n=1 Tax=Rugosibacter aromaticivorans TaxID=1565605 RepID=A0A0C5IYW1_9PROT|nr:YeeE/YedE family protein [Rugosibacter aromaticivorans]AJP47942.1 YeeE/YedE [Rugosibacter aromaticivorans]TAJ16183.1 MAG: YeeE/YedE family protein [Rugosibacter sp.]TBR12889.1 MAG: YeeE/YedE family protein [Rugosibacter sp.]
MTIDTVHFTPIAALFGGLLIGAAAALFMLINGRIAGVSGIMGGLLRPVAGNTLWRFAFVFGLLLAPVLYGAFATLPEIQLDSGYPMLIVAGLLVGIGTRYGAGCTSGHGICGISRLSPRSIVATLLFMVAGMATVFALRHLLGVTSA